MSTRSYIAKQIGDNEFKTIYCHSDGYLTHNGAMLLDHYSDPEKLDALLNLGDISYLAPNLEPDPTRPHSFEFKERQEGVVLAYGRDRGEKDVDAHVCDVDQLTSTESWVAYIYVFNKDNQWVYGSPGQDIASFRNVKEGLDSTYSYYGIDRPEGYYGFMDKEIAEEFKNQDTTEDEAPVQTM